MPSLLANPLRTDPSRTLTLRARFAAEYAKRVSLLIGDIVRLVQEDAFGLRDAEDDSVITYHFNPYHEPAGTTKGGEFASGPDGGATPSAKELAGITAWNKATGRKLEPIHFANLVGAPEGAKLTYTLLKGAGLQIITEHPDYHSTRILFAKHIVNSDSIVAVAKRGQGLGTKLFIKQVQAAAALDYEYIETDAVGRKGSHSNGYYTWPRLGFDGPLDNSDIEHNVLKEATKKFGATKVGDLMETKEGRDWWKEYGSTIGVTFDLRAESRARKILDAYVKEKESRTATTTNQRGRGDTGRDLGQLTENTRWRQIGHAQKVSAFRQWLETQIKRRLMDHDQASQVWTERYIRAAYERGRVRGTTQAAKLRRKQYVQDFLVKYNRAQQKKVELLVQESLEDSKNISTRMATRAGKIIAEGLTKRQSVSTLARRLADELGIEKTRARLIAQTEVVRAQAEGQLDAYEEFDIRKVGAIVEWTTAAGKGASEGAMEAARVCPKCRKKANRTYTIRQARGLIPLHPGCRCGWEPVEEKTGYKRKPKRPTLNFNPYHEPGGSREGGRFARAAGSPLTRAPGIKGEHRQKIADLLNKDRPITIDQIVQQTNVDRKKVEQFVAKLKRKGYIKKVQGGYIEIDAADFPPPTEPPKPKTPKEPPKEKEDDVLEYHDPLEMVQIKSLKELKSENFYKRTGISMEVRGKPKKILKLKPHPDGTGNNLLVKERALTDEQITAATNEVLAQRASLIKRFPLVHGLAMKDKDKTSTLYRRGKLINYRGQPHGIVPSPAFSSKTNSGNYRGLYSYYGDRIDVAAGLPIKHDAPQLVGVNAWTTGDDVGSVYRHEYGHHVWYRGLNKTQRAGFQGMGHQYLKKNGAYVSKYGESNIEELYAESFAAYSSRAYKRGSLPAPIEAHLDLHLHGKTEHADHKHLTELASKV